MDDRVLSRARCIRVLDRQIMLSSKKSTHFFSWSKERVPLTAGSAFFCPVAVAFIYSAWSNLLAAGESVAIKRVAHSPRLLSSIRDIGVSVAPKNFSAQFGADTHKAIARGHGFRQ